MAFLEASWSSRRGAYPCWIGPQPALEPRVLAPAEIFTAMVVLEATKGSHPGLGVRRDILTQLMRARTSEGTYHFFLERARLPADADCTGLAHSLLWEAGLLDEDAAFEAAERLRRNTTQDGVLKVYFTEAADRGDLVDPAVCANALHFLNHLGWAPRAERSERFLFETLERQSYLGGTRYYPAPETFLFFVTRLATDFPVRYQGLLPVLRRHLRPRLGQPGTSLVLAFRALAARRLALEASAERARLLRLQRDEGTWPADGFFRYGRTQQMFGSEAVTTALALSACQAPGDDDGAGRGWLPPQRRPTLRHR